MEEILSLVCGLSVLGLIGLVVAIVSVVSSSRQRRHAQDIEGDLLSSRVDNLARDLATLKGRVDALSGETTAQVSEPAQEALSPLVLHASTPPPDPIPEPVEPTFEVVELPPELVEPSVLPEQQVVAQSELPQQAKQDELPPAQKPAYVAPAQQSPILSASLEQWLGVRAAAALGSIVLFLAVLFLYRYGVERGWFSPALRVIGGVVTGVIAIGSSSYVRRQHVTLSNWLAGAGVAILYASTWAAQSLYHLIDGTISYPAMIAYTVACGVIAVRRDSVAVAALGLTGGFATPFLLSTGHDHPVGLFSYLALLNVAVIMLARRNRWPWLTFAAFCLTAIYTVTWSVTRMDPNEVVIGIVASIVFGVLFVVGADFSKKRTDDAQEQLAQSNDASSWAKWGGYLLPLSMSFVLIARNDLGDASSLVAPLVIQLMLVSLASAAFGVLRSRPWIGAAMSAASALQIAVFAATRSDYVNEPVLYGLVLTFPLLMCGLALATHAWTQKRFGRDALDASLGVFTPAAVLVSLLALVGVIASSTTPATWAANHQQISVFALIAAALVAVVTWCGRLIGHKGVPVALGIVVAMALGAMHSGAPLAQLMSVALIAAFVPLALLALAVRQSIRVPAATMSVVVACLLSVFVAQLMPHAQWVWSWVACVMLVAFCASVLLRDAIAPLVVACVALLSFIMLAYDAPASFYGSVAHVQVVIACFAAVMLPIVVAPAWLRNRVKNELLLYPTAAVASVGLGGLVVYTYVQTWSWAGSGGLAVALGSIPLLVAAHLRRVTPRDWALRKDALVWLLGVALCWFVAAVPLELYNEWITVVWAAQSLALVALDRKIGHSGLKLVVTGLFAAVSIRLLLNPEILHYHARGWPILNWLAYGYLIPVACMLVAGALYAKLGAERSNANMRALARCFVVAGLLIAFAWINLTIVDAFSTGRMIAFDFERDSARDLSLSLGWAAYAIMLLVAGVRRSNSGLRWASLALVIITVSKVFLYDLSQLAGLYRVASLTGLAFSLIGISLAYQRFVFVRRIES